MERIHGFLLVLLQLQKNVARAGYGWRVCIKETHRGNTWSKCIERIHGFSRLAAITQLCYAYRYGGYAWRLCVEEMQGVNAYHGVFASLDAVTQLCYPCRVPRVCMESMHGRNASKKCME